MGDIRALPGFGGGIPRSPPDGSPGRPHTHRPAAHDGARRPRPAEPPLHQRHRPPAPGQWNHHRPHHTQRAHRGLADTPPPHPRLPHPPDLTRDTPRRSPVDRQVHHRRRGYADGCQPGPNGPAKHPGARGHGSGGAGPRRLGRRACTLRLSPAFPPRRRASGRPAPTP